eukprot:767930-Hanusia_phi.AAC.1
MVQPDPERELVKTRTRSTRTGTTRTGRTRKTRGKRTRTVTRSKRVREQEGEGTAGEMRPEPRSCSLTCKSAYSCAIFCRRRNKDVMSEKKCTGGVVMTSGEDGDGGVAGGGKEDELKCFDRVSHLESIEAIPPARLQMSFAGVRIGGGAEVREKQNRRHHLRQIHRNQHISQPAQVQTLRDVQLR